MASPYRTGSNALRKGRASRAHGVYLVTWATQGRQPFFSAFRTARMAAASLVGSVALGDARLLAWVLMPDHVHVLLQLGERDPLWRVVSRVKARLTLAIRCDLGGRKRIWQAGYHDRALRTERQVLGAARYIVGNPVRAGLASSCRMNPYWDAAWREDPQAGEELSPS